LVKDLKNIKKAEMFLKEVSIPMNGKNHTIKNGGIES
jgi:hypothetical protein